VRTDNFWQTKTTRPVSGGYSVLYLKGSDNNRNPVRSERTICTICYYSTSFLLSLPGGIATYGSTGVDTVCGVPGLNGPGLANGLVDKKHSIVTTNIEVELLIIW